MINALTKSINSRGFDQVFKEVLHSESLGLLSNEELRLFRLKEVIDNKFSKDSLRTFISKNIGHYVFSRSRIEQFRVEGDEFSVGIEALDLMYKSGRADEKGTGNELGEILLYAFLETVLGAPKIYSKIELNSSVKSGISACDGMHLRALDSGGKTLSYEMIFGTSCVVGDLGYAIDEAFECIQQISGRTTEELQIVDSTVFELPADDPVALQLNDIIKPAPGKDVYRDTAFGIFLGYTIGLDSSRYKSSDYRDALEKKMDNDIKHYAPYIKEKINKLSLNNRSFYVYVLPFDNAEVDKKAIMKTVMREGESYGR